MDTFEAIETRRSIRSYEDRPVSREDLDKIVNAGRLAASARNVQPCRFVVVTERATLDKMARMIDTARFLSEATACVITFSEETKYFLEDGSAATQNMLVAARALGLGTCWVAGDKKPFAPEVEKMFNAPENVRLISLMAVGYASETPSPSKKTLDEVRFWENF